MLNITICKHGPVQVIEVDGRFYIDSIVLVEEIWRNALWEGPETIAIRCEKLKCIDSSAVGTLVRFFNSAESQSVELVFLDLNENIEKLFATAKLNHYFTISTSADFFQRHSLIPASERVVLPAR